MVPSADCLLLLNATAPMKSPGLAGAGTSTVNDADRPGPTTWDTGLTAPLTFWNVWAVSR